MKNLVARRAVRIIRRAPRAFAAWTADRADFEQNPPVIANSVPKSGTHLLAQILEALPGIQDYSTFWASTPSVSFKERSVKSTIRMIRSAAPGELVRAHLHYHEGFCAPLAELNGAHFFIFRDPRDVIVSEVNYLTHMNPYHRLHRHFKNQPDEPARIKLAIEGCSDLGPGIRYPDVAERFSRFIPWLRNPKVFSCRYEDLMSDDREHVIESMMTFYGDCQKDGHSVNECVERALGNIDPKRSHTFRNAVIGNWREVFSEDHREAMARIAGDLLIELGYERDLSWSR